MWVWCMVIMVTMALVMVITCSIIWSTRGITLTFVFTVGGYPENIFVISKTSIARNYLNYRIKNVLRWSGKENQNEEPYIKCERKPEGQWGIDNPKMPSILSTRHRTKTNKTKNIKNTKNHAKHRCSRRVNRSCFL